MTTERTVLCEYAVMAMCAAAGIAAVRMSAPGQWMVLGTAVVALIAAMVWVDLSPCEVVGGY